MSTYGYSKTISGDFDTVIKKTTEALQVEGFGVLTVIDVKDKFREKLGIDYDDYVILGACNPSQAHRALAEEKELGLLLPCNVIVYKNADRITVSALRPQVAMSFIGNKKLEAIAGEVEDSLKRVIDSL